MKINQIKGLGYDGKSGIIGIISKVDYIEGKVTVLADEGEKVLNIEDAILLEEICSDFNGSPLYNSDVIILQNAKTEEDAEKAWEIELLDDGKIVLHLLEVVKGELKRVKAGEPFKRELLESLSENFELIGNINEIELELEESVDFNIIIVRKQNLEGLEYFYACNNKEVQEVDLIKVVFVGAKLLEEEYSRDTLNYEEYLELVNDGVLKEASPQELQNYVTGLTYRQNQEEEFVEGVGIPDTYEEDKTDYDNYCPDCEYSYIDCECE